MRTRPSRAECEGIVVHARSRALSRRPRHLRNDEIMGFNRSLRAPMKAPVSTDESSGMSVESLGGVSNQML